MIGRRAVVEVQDGQEFRLELLFATSKTDGTFSTPCQAFRSQRILPAYSVAQTVQASFTLAQQRPRLGLYPLSQSQRRLSI